MPDSMDFDVTASPRALEDTLSLDAGGRYAIWNVDTTATVQMRTAAAAPAATAKAIKLSPGGEIELIAASGTKTWCWSTDPDGASLLIETIPSS